MTFSKVPVLSLVCALLAGSHASAAESRPLEERISGFVTSQGFNGVILVADRDTVLHHQAYGHADLEAGTPTALGTRYQLGSISKYLASLVVLKLVDEGKLSLSRPISGYLPSYPKEAGGKVTLHHLLSHTSGIPNDVVKALRGDPAVARTELPTASAVERYASGALQFEPGSRFDYAHSNWIVVRALIERASGRSYEENVQRLLGPLKLKDTGIFTGDFASIPGGAVGYSAVRPVPKRASAPVPGFMACAGGAYGTAADVLALSRAVHEGRLLSRDSVRRLTTAHVTEEGYAYGGHVRTLKLGGRDEAVSWLSGSNGPFKTRVSRVLSSGLTVILLSKSNTNQEALGTLTQELLQDVSAAPRGKPKR